MKHPERAEDFLEHIALAIDRITEYMMPFTSVDELARNHQAQDAVVRNIEIIGEASTQLAHHAPEFVQAHPELPWIEMRGMRNKMIHGYFDVSYPIIWNTIKDDLPRLKQQVDALLKN